MFTPQKLRRTSLKMARRINSQSNVSLVTFLIPISATGLGWAFLSERLGIGELIGALLIGAGLAAMDGRLLRWLRHQVTPNA